MTFDPGLLLRDVQPEKIKAIPWLFPYYIDEKGGLIISYQALLVEAPGLKLIVDTCVGNNKMRGFAPHSHLSTPFLEHMTEAGFSRKDVDVVICTHMHYDHVGWNTMLENGLWAPTFPNARYLFARTEYEHWQRNSGSAVMAQAEVISDSIRPVFETGLATLVETDHRISNEVRLMPTPGHTPGHVSVLIESDGQTAIISGDALVHPCQIAHPEWVAPHEEDPALVIQTRNRMLDRCASGLVLFIGTHFPAPAAGRVHRRGNSYRFDGLINEQLFKQPTRRAERT
jgi:glyoxylase-like metal-dependent hydrolase (beta-lactamase superfamily II)